MNSMRHSLVHGSYLAAAAMVFAITTAVAQQIGDAVEPGTGIAAAGAHAKLLKDDARPDLGPGVSVQGPVTVTIARADGSTRRYVGARNLTYFAARDSLTRAHSMITFEGAVVFTVPTSDGGTETVSLDQGMVTVTAGSASDL